MPALLLFVVLTRPQRKTRSGPGHATSFPTGDEHFAGSDATVCIIELTAFATSLSLFKLGFELVDLNLPSRPIVVGRTKLKQKWVG
uniref:Putative secreted protein n=1 Tax=Ixodes ricinus TaxID=34613 RepID=A0A6B0U4I8_IXORI